MITEVMNTENKLKRLFDYQRFENDPRLAAMIRETESRYAAFELDDELLGMVNAAGDIELEATKNQNYKNGEDTT